MNLLLFVRISFVPLAGDVDSGLSSYVGVSYLFTLSSLFPILFSLLPGISLV